MAPLTKTTLDGDVVVEAEVTGQGTQSQGGSTVKVLHVGVCGLGLTTVLSKFTGTSTVALVCLPGKGIGQVGTGDSTTTLGTTSKFTLTSGAVWGVLGRVEAVGPTACEVEVFLVQSSMTLSWVSRSVTQFLVWQGAMISTLGRGCCTTAAGWPTTYGAGAQESPQG